MAESGRTWRTWQLLLGVGLALVIGIAAGAGTSEQDETVRATDRMGKEPRDPVGEPMSITTSTLPAPSSAPTTTTPPQPRDIVTFAGSSTKTTESFAVRSPWRLRWKITGGAGVGIEIYDAGGTRLEFISTDPGQDETIVRQSCTCYLKLEPFGSSYSITVNGIAA